IGASLRRCQTAHPATSGRPRQTLRSTQQGETPKLSGGGYAIHEPPQKEEERERSSSILLLPCDLHRTHEDTRRGKGTHSKSSKNLLARCNPTRLTTRTGQGIDLTHRDGAGELAATDHQQFTRCDITHDPLLGL